MKNVKRMIAITLCLLSAAVLLCACSDSTQSEQTTSTGTVEKQEDKGNTLGDYVVEMKSARLAKDFEGKDIVIVTYGFTNNNAESKAFTYVIDDKVYQNGIECAKCYFADESANYQDENQSKAIKTGATLDIEVAYNLNDMTTPIEVEVAELFSLSDKKITKTFDLQ